jgi:hypothetical protein
MRPIESFFPCGGVSPQESGIVVEIWGFKRAMAQSPLETFPGSEGAIANARKEQMLMLPIR